MKIVTWKRRRRGSGMVRSLEDRISIGRLRSA